MWPKIIDACFFLEGTLNFLTHCATGKHFLIRITLMGTKNLYCEAGGARGKLLDHSLERGARASHTGQVQRTTGGGFHFKNETVVMGKGYILSPSSRLVNF